MKALVSNPEEEAKSFLESAFAALKLNKKYPALPSSQQLQYIDGEYARLKTQYLVEKNFTATDILFSERMNLLVWDANSEISRASRPATPDDIAKWRQTGRSRLWWWLYDAHGNIRKSTLGGEDGFVARMKSYRLTKAERKRFPPRLRGQKRR